METNPYSPPKATVADPLEDLRPRERPPQVRTLMQLLWLSFAISVVSLFFSWRQISAIPYWQIAMVFVVLSYLLILLITIKIGQGRNWARITYLVLAIIGLPFFFIGLKEALVSDRLSAVLGLVQTALQIASVYLMFFSPAKEWFRKAA